MNRCEFAGDSTIREICIVALQLGEVAKSQGRTVDWQSLARSLCLLITKNTLENFVLPALTENAD